MSDTYLVFDTNALPTKGLLESGFWSALFRVCEIKGIKPAISEVTLDEAVNMRMEAANKILTPLVAAHTALSQVTRVDPLYTPTADSIATEYEARLHTVFEVLPLDGLHAIEALRREARRIVPARHGKGGRDSAIWLTIAKLANDGHRVHFVTNNHKDFGHGGLFTELLGEVVDATEPIEYLASPNDFIDQIATKLVLPDLLPADVADAFSLSIRSLIIGTLEAVESAEYTVDRAWNAVITVEAVKKGQGYEIDGQGLVQVRATVKLADPSGVQWATGRMSGWLNFEPTTFAGIPSDADELIDLDLR